MHVRILVPPKGRVPVWPGLREDGRVSWPKGVDALTVRIYTIRFVNLETQELWLDFVQHTAKQLPTPGADFARDAVPGDRLAIVGPGGGHLPQHDFLLLAGDESALPAIARIAAEVPEGTRIEAIIEVADHREVQSLPSKASMNVTWIYRDDIAQSVAESLSKITVRKLTEMSEKPYVWFAAERSEVKFVKEYLKASQHDKKRKYTAWYWERDKAQAGD
jgi:NADPH-dependent ferric siderophore reductase